MAGSTLNREDYKTAIPQLSSQMKEILDNNVVINRTVINLTEGKVSDLNSYLGYFQSLTTGYFQAIAGDVQFLSSRQAYLGQLKADIAGFGYLTADSAVIENLQVGNLTIGGQTVNVWDKAVLAESTANDVADILDDMADAAQAAHTTLTQIYADAESAKTDATTARSAADSAMKGLGQVEDVVGVLEWITSHGEMESQQGETFDSTKVYFIIDPNGDYVIGGTHYSLVTNPVAADIDSYYCLSVDRSIQNYVATHIVVDSEGLWIIPDSGGNKVLIATGGTGKRYETAGTYIVSKVGNNDVTLASFTTDGVQIGRDNETHVDIDYHSLQLVDKENNTYFHVSDSRTNHESSDEYGSGFYYVNTETFTGDGTQRYFYLEYEVFNAGYTVTVDGVDKTSRVQLGGGGTITFQPTDIPSDGSEVVVEYASNDDRLKTLTFGSRQSQGKEGSYSMAHGDGVLASGALSHAHGFESKAVGYCSGAEGSESIALGDFAHAEGNRSQANGDRSHAEGSGKANGECSHAEGFGRADGEYSHAEGRATYANGDCSHAEGYNTYANGNYSHAEGHSTIVNGNYAHGEGYNPNANGDYSHASGYRTTAGYEAQTAIGRRNKNKAKNAFEIGNGTDTESNAFAVDWYGKVECGDNQGTLTALLDLIHPVGSYYWTSDGNFLPEDVFGGRWEKIDAGVTLVSAGTGYTVTSGTAKDGGSEDSIVPYHRHSVSEQSTGNMSANSSHSHTVGYVNYKRASTTAATTAVSYAEATSNKTTSSESVQHTHKVPSHNTGYEGTSGTGANMPPYKCAYCWHRTA